MGDGIHPSMYYDWSKTFSFNADVTMVITRRDRGKTFGLRMAALDDAIRHGYRFVEVVRHSHAELPEVMAGYFEKLAMLPKYSGYEFKTEARRGYYRPVPPPPDDGDEDVEERASDEPWRLACYFVALSDAQNAKKRTYINVRKIIFDEALIEPDPHHRYLPREWQVLANLVDTVTRETGLGDGVRPHLYLLSNACSLTNPYFAAWRIDSVPPYGYSWWMGHRVLLHYEDPKDAPIDRAETTLAGRMISGTDEGRTALENEFIVAATDDIHPKPSCATFWAGLIYMGTEFGVWIDWVDGYYYVTRSIPKNAKHVYALTRRDNSANRLIARSATPAMKAIAAAHYDRIIRYDSVATREQLLDALQMFGVR